MGLPGVQGGPGLVSEGGAAESELAADMAAS